MKESTIIRKVAMGELPAKAIDLVAAVMKEIECGCGREILDVKTAVLVVTSSGANHVMTGRCWDGNKDKVTAVLASRDVTITDVIDGRAMKWGK